MKSFRAISPVLALLVWITGCIGLENMGTGENGGGEPGMPEPESVPDTIVLMVGAEYPPEYDWKRDTAYGKVHPDIVLFRNGERVLTLHTGGSGGLSPHPDMYYLMDDGHLYSQSQKGGSTVIFRDGKEYVSYKGNELIQGLVVLGNDVYSLGQNRNGGGFSYRKNGKRLLSSDSGHIVGQMNSNPHYRSGALYSDEGQLCFSYWKEADKGQYSWTLVTDGVESPLQLKCSPSGLYDLRVIGGEIHRLMSTPQTRSCVLITGASEYDAGPKNSPTRLCALGPGGPGGILVSGQYQMREGSFPSFLWSHAQGIRLGLGRSYYYAGEQGVCEVSFMDSGAFSVAESGRVRKMVRGEGWYYPSFRNGIQVGGELYLALNPTEEGRQPGWWADGKWREVELNGYLSGIQVLLVEKE